MLPLALAPSRALMPQYHFQHSKVRISSAWNIEVRQKPLPAAFMRVACRLSQLKLRLRRIDMKIS